MMDKRGTNETHERPQEWESDGRDWREEVGSDTSMYSFDF